MTPELLSHIQKKDKLLKNAHGSNTKTDWDIDKKAQNRVLNQVKYTKAAYFKTLLNKYKNDSKSFWQTIKQITLGEGGRVAPASSHS